MGSCLKPSAVQRRNNGAWIYRRPLERQPGVAATGATGHRTHRTRTVTAAP